MVLSFQHKEVVKVDKLDTLLLPDACKTKRKDMWFELMGQQRHGKRTACNKKMGYL
jgi:hypothetical protein